MGFSETVTAVVTVISCWDCKSSPLSFRLSVSQTVYASQFGSE